MNYASGSAMAAVVFAAGLLAMGATAPRVMAGEKPAGARAADACVFASRLDNFRALDNERLIVWTPGSKQPYLLTLAFPSTELRWGETLGLDDRNHDGMICGFGPDAVIIPHGMPDRIMIRSMEKISPEQAQELVASSRKGIGKEPSAASRK
jgi:Family of unknown function (DUF6491)